MMHMTPDAIAHADNKNGSTFMHRMGCGGKTPMAKDLVYWLAEDEESPLFSDFEEPDG